jgi:RNA polymerase sigma factor (sigma-70 family)
MSDTTSEFSRLMEQLQRGSQEVAWELIERYGPHVQRYVRRSLSQEMRSKFDSIDFAQVVWASFFREPQRIRQFSSPEQLMAFLAAMARNKVVAEFRRWLISQKRNVGREIRIERTDFAHGRQLSSSDPTPSAVAVARERWSRLLHNQPESVRRILELRFYGATYVEIASELKMSERTVRRAVAELIDDPAYAELVDAEAT